MTPRVRTLRKMSRQERPQASETTRPSEVQQTGDVEEATTKDVQNLLQHLRAALKESQRNAVHYFKFLVHPTSFSQTVENIFHLSFLIKVCSCSYSICSVSMCNAPSHRMDVSLWN